MIGEHQCVVDLGPVRVAVATDHADLIEYLRDFYPLDGHAGGNDWEGTAEWVFEARLSAPAPAMALTPWRVGYQADPDARRAVLASSSPHDLAITTRKTIREVLLAYCEARRYIMLHASALAADQWVLIVVGDKGSGKTTLALNGVLSTGHRYLSNDHLILYHGLDGLVVTSLPTPIPVKIGTYLDYAELLGQPWENEGIDIESYRRMPRHQRYRHDQRLLFTYQSLGQANPLHTVLEHRQVVVLLASYAPADQPVGAPEPVADPMAALWPHVRFDWVFDPVRNTHHLPRVERDRDTYARDARARLAELVARAVVVEWRHHGQVGPLLEWLATRPAPQR